MAGNGRQRDLELIQEDDRVELIELRRQGSDADEEIPLRRSVGNQGKSYGVRHTPNPLVSACEKLKVSNWRRYLLFWKSHSRIHKAEKPKPRRTIHINNPQLNRHFCSNHISTAKYNLLSFFPLFLFDQFRRTANLFFLAIALLQQIPGISPTGRFTTAVPLFLVLLAVAVKEIIEDLRRHRADSRQNRQVVKVLRGVYEDTHWKNVVVGDIVSVRDKQFFPADLLLLSSSDPKSICYVKTSNLDGETNLKIKQAHPETSLLSRRADLLQLKGCVECEGPNNRLYEFTGNISVQGKGRRAAEPILTNQILLRGSQLRNTRWVLGLVIYTGHDSKLLRNANRAPLKRSNMESITNGQVLYLFFVLVVLSLVSSIASTVWNSLNSHRFYLRMEASTGSAVLHLFYSFLTFLILYNNLIPISLIVTLEVVKYIQAYFINFDRDLYYSETDTPALARNSNLSEELGQVKYIFADKTGTLTRNEMELKQCSIAGQSFSVDATHGQDQIASLKRVIKVKGKETAVLVEFLKVLALCHSVVPESDKKRGVAYQASSPDEEALVKAASACGVKLLSRTPETVTIDVFGQTEEYKVLNLLEFTSDRKRMSVILRSPEGSIRLMCKGAESVVFNRLVEGDPLCQETGRHLEKFALDGLRTLCISATNLDEATYMEWEKVYYAASTSQENRERALDEAAELIEKNLHLLGATAVEDKLQERVPESIECLRKASIKVWVLTGDKQETAIATGFSSKQLTGLNLMICNERTQEAVNSRLSSFANQLSLHNRKELSEHKSALIIDGQALAHAMDPSISKLFLDLALSCKSVVCSRVTPAQKAAVVELVKRNVKRSITLAIGDGANDVAMIQAAHVGVGISGREGMQATLASDYAFAQFHFLVKLLLVHGAWNYHRLSKLILYCFYKNICLYMIEFWFVFYNGFSGQPIFERWTIGLYNVIFTSLPPLVLGLFDKDVDAEVRMLRPSLYRSSQRGTSFNSKVFWIWVAVSIVHSLAIFFVIYYGLHHGAPLHDGKVVGLWFVGNTIYTATVVTVCVKAGLESEYWPWVTHAAIWGSIISWFLFVAAYSHFWPTFPVAVEMVGLDSKLFGSFLFYLSFLLCPAICILPEVLVKSFRMHLFPSEVDKAKLEQQQCPAGYLSVSYSNKRPRARLYGDGLDDAEESPLEYTSNAISSSDYGYAFSEQDHRSLKHGAMKIHKRDVIRM